MNNQYYQMQHNSNNINRNTYQNQQYARQQPQTQSHRQRIVEKNEGLPFKFGEEGQYILYYSNYCINCKEFINILCKSPLYSQFTKINVSSNTSFPNFVKSVPTIVVPNIQRPLVGEEVFKWLEEQSTRRVQNEDRGIIPYSPGEMGSGLADTYSYLDAKDTEQPMEHTFSFIKRNEQKIETPPEDSFINTKPKAIQDVSREQFPQHQVQQNFEHQPSSPRPSHGMGAKPPMLPVCSEGNDNTNVEDAYNELMARRKMDIPTN